MPREQQICEQLASPLLYLFPPLCEFGENRILLSISRSYLTDFKWRDSHSLSSPHTTHFHLCTSLQHFDSFPFETRLVSLKSIPTLFPMEKSVLALNTQKKAPNPTLNHSHSSHSHSLPSKTTTSESPSPIPERNPNPQRYTRSFCLFHSTPFPAHSETHNHLNTPLHSIIPLLTITFPLHPISLPPHPPCKSNSTQPK